MDVILYTDGSARGNPNGPGGYGAVLQFIDAKGQLHEREYSQGYIKTTNNRMEMSAILWALTHYGAKDGDFFTPIVYSDSMYCVNSFTNWIKNWKANGWVRAGNKPLENKDLILEYDRLTTKEGLRVDLRYVKGHNGTLFNELADQLATGKITEQQVLDMYGG